MDESRFGKDPITEEGIYQFRCDWGLAGNKEHGEIWLYDIKDGWMVSSRHCVPWTPFSYYKKQPSSEWYYKGPMTLLK